MMILVMVIKKMALIIDITIITTMTAFVRKGKNLVRKIKRKKYRWIEKIFIDQEKLGETKNNVGGGIDQREEICKRNKAGGKHTEREAGQETMKDEKRRGLVSLIDSRRERKRRSGKNKRLTERQGFDGQGWGESE